jgi:uncharacterized repeat protein (TIGR03803 family)
MKTIRLFLAFFEFVHRARVPRKRLAPKPLLLAAMRLLAIFGLLVTITQPAHSQSLGTLYAFSGGADGEYPRVGVIFGADGNLYGVSDSYYAGTVFQLTTLGDFTVVHHFTGSPDGLLPYGGITLDARGNLVGATYAGGTRGKGTVYEVTTTGTETELYNFPFPGPPSVPHPIPPHGAGPGQNLVLDAQGNIYGTTNIGSFNPPACLKCGAVCELTATGTEKLLYGFAGSPNDGEAPGDLAIDPQGNLYGITQLGGASNGGIVFKLTQSGQETVLHSFSGSPNDGYGPFGRLLLDAHGNLYGSTTQGGTYGTGTIFKLTPSGAETILYNFTKGTDGDGPLGTLAMDAQGNLYGATGGGGTYGWGTIFELTASGTEKVLYSFTGGADGEVPSGGVILKGNSLYGTTSMGGNNSGCVNRVYKGCGTVFVLSLN